MSTKKKLIIVCMIIVIIVVAIGIGIKVKRDTKRTDIKVPVLLYHNFVTTVPENDPDNFNYINTPESFEENVKTFLENGYTIISMKELAEADNGKTELPAIPMLITFDDGYYSNYEYIYPILKQYQVKASIFVVIDKIAQEMDGIKYLVSYEQIEKYLGKQDLKIFAYPYGAYTNETVRTLKNNGIDFQIYDIGMNDFKDFDKHAIKRINIPCEMTGKEIIEEIESY